MSDLNPTISVSAGVSEEMKIDASGIAGRWAELDQARHEVLERAKEMAGLTIPSIFPDTLTGETDYLDVPYQGTGARIVNNLSNKLLLTLFPVSSPFFKLEVPEAVVQQFQDQQDDIKNQLEQKLLEMEHIIQSDMEINAFRTKIFEAIRSLIVVGNFLLHIPAKGEPIGYRMDKYVVKRSVSGTVLEIILKEQISKAEMQPRWIEQLESAQAMMPNSDEIADTTKKNKFDMYTRIYLDGNKYREAKYIYGVELEGTQGSYPKDSSAWLPLRWNALSGEDYGRSYVEEYFGDLRTLDGLQKAINEHSAIASKTFGIIRPNSMMTPEDITRVSNGGFVTGDPEDIFFPEIGKYNDMQVAKATIGEITESLSRAFLLTQTRDAERVTAEEIRLQASELETALGGAYSLLAINFQQPILMRQIARLKKSGAIQNVNNQDIEPKIIVGLEGLGRGTDLDKFMRAVAALGQMAPVLEQIPDIDKNKTLIFTFNAVGLDGEDVLKSVQKKQQEAAALQQQQAQQLAADMATKAVSSGTGEMIKQGVENPEATANLVQNAQQALQPQ